MESITIPVFEFAFGYLLRVLETMRLKNPTDGIVFTSDTSSLLAASKMSTYSNKAS